MSKQNSKKNTRIISNTTLSEVNISKPKRKKEEYVIIEAIVGSIIITPKEIEAFKKHGVDLSIALRTIQREIYKKKKP